MNLILSVPVSAPQAHALHQLLRNPEPDVKGFFAPEGSRLDGT